MRGTSLIPPIGSRRSSGYSRWQQIDVGRYLAGALTTEERAKLRRLQRENQRGPTLLGVILRSPLALCRRRGDERAHHGCPHPRRPRPGRGAAAPTSGPGASFGSWEPVRQRRLHDAARATRAAAHAELFDPLEGYHGQPRHSALGYLSPASVRARARTGRGGNLTQAPTTRASPTFGGQPSAEGRTDLAFPRPHQLGDGLAHSSDPDVQCPL